MKKILIIENERMVFLDLKIMFTKAGYEVFSGNAFNIEQICETEFKPDFIILDVLTVKNMKGMLKMAFKCYSKFKNIPVITTSTENVTNIGFCFKKSINLIAEINKPYDSTDILEIYVRYISAQKLLETNPEYSFELEYKMA